MFSTSSNVGCERNHRWGPSDKKLLGLITISVPWTCSPLYVVCTAYLGFLRQTCWTENECLPEEHPEAISLQKSLLQTNSFVISSFVWCEQTLPNLRIKMRNKDIIQGDIFHFESWKEHLWQNRLTLSTGFSPIWEAWMIQCILFHSYNMSTFIWWLPKCSNLFYTQSFEYVAI